MNVAFGYLSVLLGYLCLGEAVRDRFVLLHAGRNLAPLVGAIGEFIAFHRAADDATEASDDESSRFIGRLQTLVNDLDRE